MKFIMIRNGQKSQVYTLAIHQKRMISVAPKGMENLMVLIPVAPGLKDTEETREHYYNYALKN